MCIAIEEFEIVPIGLKVKQTSTKTSVYLQQIQSITDDVDWRPSAEYTAGCRKMKAKYKKFGLSDPVKTFTQPLKQKLHRMSRECDPKNVLDAVQGVLAAVIRRNFGVSSLVNRRKCQIYFNWRFKGIYFVDGFNCFRSLLKWMLHKHWCYIIWFII